MASLGSSVRIEGLKNLQRAIEECDAELEAWLKDGLLEIGEHVADDVRKVYARYSKKGAERVKAKVMKRGNVLVAQTLSKSRQMNRRRRNFGGLMMREAFMPAAERNESYVLAQGESLLRQLEERWK